MLADYYEIPKEEAIKKVEDFEKKVKEQFKKENQERNDRMQSFQGMA